MKTKVPLVGFLVFSSIIAFGLRPSTELTFSCKFCVSKNYLNPFASSTNVDMYNTNDKNVNICVRDLIVRDLFSRRRSKIENY